MKKFISILMIGFLLTSCNKEVKKTDGYVINGTAKGIYNGMRVYLKAPNAKANEPAQDTAIVMNETFKFEGKMQYPQLWYLSVTNVNGIVPVMIENEVIDIDFNKDDIEASKVSGSEGNKALAEYSKGYKTLMDKGMDINKRFTQIQNPNSGIDSLGSIKITAEFGKINQELQSYPLDFLEKHRSNYFSLSLIENMLQSNVTDVTPYENAYTNLDDTIKNSMYGSIVANKLAVLKQKNESLTMLNIGKVAPDFTAPDPDGKQVSLYGIRGKVTIIDFWASWCGPCRKENPNVVKVFEKFHDKGLEIISVSLDKQGQKEKWLKAIEDDKLNWHHVSNLNYFNDPVAEQYNIQSIPATFILDEDGKIVAKSLRGQALEDKIAEMLN